MLRSLSRWGINPTFSLKNVLIFAAGTILGFTYFFMWIDSSRGNKSNSYPRINSKEDYAHGRKKFQNSLKSFNGNLPIVYEVDRSLAEDLAEKVRVLCWVNVDPKDIDQAKVVKATWGRRCNVLLFTSTKANKALPTVTFNMTTDWGKTKQGFTYIHEKYLDEADWFLKVDAHHYVVLENLRHLLETYNPRAPIYFGRHYQHFIPQGYMSGGAGYVLSKGALRRFVERALKDPDKCRLDDGGLEDMELGYCLNQVGVVTGDSRDKYGYGRFFPFDVATHLIKDLRKDEIEWYWEFTKISYPDGIDCCSETTIAFHFVFYEFMYVYDYLLYNLNSRLIN